MWRSLAQFGLDHSANSTTSRFSTMNGISYIFKFNRRQTEYVTAGASTYKGPQKTPASSEGLLVSFFAFSTFFNVAASSA